MAYTTAELINRIKRNAAVPTRQPAFSNDDLLEILTDEMDSVIAPLIISINEEYFVKYLDYAISGSSGIYRVPKNAIGGKLREIKIIDGENEKNIPRILLTEKSDYEFGFYIENNFVNVLNYNDLGGDALRMYYYDRPGRFVEVSDCALITSKDDATDTVTVNSVPASWTDSTTVDIIQAVPPFDKLVDESGITLVSNSIVLDSYNNDITAGCYVCESGYTCVPQIPVEAHSLLCQSAIIKVLEALNDTQGLQNAIAKYQQMERNIVNLLTPRVKGERKILSTQHGFF